LAQRLSRHEAVQIIDEDRQQRRPLLLRQPADTRAKDNMGRFQSSESSGSGWRVNASNAAPAISFLFNACTSSFLFYRLATCEVD